MTSLERVLAVFEGNRPDRIPVIPIVGQAAAKLNGMTMGEELKSSEVLAGSRITCLERFHYDGIYISADTWVTAEAMGAPVSYSDDAPVEGTTPLLGDRNKIDQLKSPDPSQDGRMPLLVKAVEIASRRSKDQFAVIGNFDQSPFSLACALRGINQLMMDLYDEPSFVKKLLEICTESVLRYAKAIAAAGAHILNTGDSPVLLVGPENYENFALPYEQIVFDELKSYGIPSTLHICGDTTRILELMGKSCAQGIEVDSQVALPLARKSLPEDITLIGNIDPVGVMLEARPEKVTESVHHLLDSSFQLGKFILSTGCALAPDTSPENVHAMVEAVM
jgi:uroporphyrinogen decarboxylase